MEPTTVWERSDDETASGMRLATRAATFSIDGARRSAVTLTMQVPEDFGASTGGSVSATILLNPDEAETLAAWLREASVAATQAAPPMYG